MAKKEVVKIKLQIAGGKATPAPPVGPALGQHGVAIQDFCSKFNEATKDKRGQIIPAEVTIYEDRRKLKYQDELLKAQDEAKYKRRNIWLKD